MKKRTISESHKLAVANSSRGRIWLEESKRKISIANTGRFPNEKTREKMRSSRLNYLKNGGIGPNRKSFGESTTNILYSHYKRRGIKNYEHFDIDIEYFKILIKDNCFYCGSEPLGEYKGNKTSYGATKYNGLDRINNNLGYIKSNVVTCCKICNAAKGELSYENFLLWINKIYRHIEGKCQKISA